MNLCSKLWLLLTYHDGMRDTAKPGHHVSFPVTIGHGVKANIEVVKTK